MYTQQVLGGYLSILLLNLFKLLECPIVISYLFEEAGLNEGAPDDLNFDKNWFPFDVNDDLNS